MPELIPPDPPSPSPSSDTFVEVKLPLVLNHSWVAHACRAAGLAKPRWNHVDRVWTARAAGEDGAVEVISIRAGSGGSSVRVETDLTDQPSATVRRIVTALVTGMQWALARREGRDRPL